MGHRRGETEQDVLAVLLGAAEDARLLDVDDPARRLRSGRRPRWSSGTRSRRGGDQYVVRSLDANLEPCVRGVAGAGRPRQGPGRAPPIRACGAPAAGLAGRARGGACRPRSPWTRTTGCPARAPWPWTPPSSSSVRWSPYSSRGKGPAPGGGRSQRSRVHHLAHGVSPLSSRLVDGPEGANARYGPAERPDR